MPDRRFASQQPRGVVTGQRGAPGLGGGFAELSPRLDGQNAILGGDRTRDVLIDCHLYPWEVEDPSRVYAQRENYLLLHITCIFVSDGQRYPTRCFRNLYPS